MFQKILVVFIISIKLVVAGDNFSDYPKIDVLDFYEKIFSVPMKDEFETKKEYGLRLSKRFKSPIIYISTNNPFNKSIKYDVETNQIIMYMDEGRSSIENYYYKDGFLKLFIASFQYYQLKDKQGKPLYKFSIPMSRNDAKKRSKLPFFGYEFIVKMDLQKFSDIFENKYIKNGQKIHVLNFSLEKEEAFYIYDKLNKSIIYERKL